MALPCALKMLLSTPQDPREYLPFLRELRAMDHHYQRFRIDDHLKRHEKALTNLSRAGMKFCVELVLPAENPLSGPERFDEAMAYVEKHRLYDHALSLWRETDKYEVCHGHRLCKLQGSWGTLVRSQHLRGLVIRASRIQGGGFRYAPVLYPSIYCSNLCLVFRQASKLEKAMLSHEKALDWQELFELAVQQELSEDALKDIAYRVAGKF